MRIKKSLSRREATKKLAIAAGLALTMPTIARAAVPTPEQVEGPFYPVVPQADMDLDLTRIKGHSRAATGETILVQGRVLGADGRPLRDALVDVWQANHHGRYAHPEDPNTAPLDADFQGWGMIRTDAEGRYSFKTIKPGAYALPAMADEGSWRSRHIHFKVSREGFKALTTQMYFRGDPLIEQDRLIAKAPAELRHLLIADSVIDSVSGLPLYQFDVVLASGLVS